MRRAEQKAGNSSESPLYSTFWTKLGFFAVFLILLTFSWTFYFGFSHLILLLRKINGVTLHILADCDLRGSRHPRTDPDWLYSIFCYLKLEAEEIKNCKLIIATLIPSIENQEICEPFFLEFDTALRGR